MELTNERKETLFNKMKEVFSSNKNYVKIDDESVNAYIELWSKNKDHIYQMFKEREEWREEDLCLVVNTKVKRESDKSKACRYLEVICNALGLNKTYYRMFKYIITQTEDDTLQMGAGYTQSTVDDERYIPDAVNGSYSWDLTYSYWFYKCKLRKGMKLSKVICKLLDGICNRFKKDYTNMTYTLDEEVKIRNSEGGFTTTNEHRWEQLKAKLCDSLVPLTVDETFYISINPLDYLTMSHGEKWESCHSLKKNGCYHSATVTMLADTSTIIVYTLNKKHTMKKDFWKKDKLTREIVCLSNDLDGIFQQTFYPSKTTNDNEVVKDYLQKLISEYKKTNLSWVKSSYGKEDLVSVKYRGYRDWECGKESLLTKLNNTNPVFRIGEHVPFLDNHEQTLNQSGSLTKDRWAVCKECGQIHKINEGRYNGDKFYCMHCYNEKFTRCVHCDCNVSNDDLVIIDGLKYCSHCASRIDYKTVEDGTNRTTYYTYQNGQDVKYYSSVEALTKENPNAILCETHNIYYEGSKCPKCLAKEQFGAKKQKVIEKINTLEEGSEYFQYKEEFLTILNEEELPEEIVELINEVSGE